LSSLEASKVFRDSQAPYKPIADEFSLSSLKVLLPLSGFGHGAVAHDPKIRTAVAPYRWQVFFMSSRFSTIKSTRVIIASTYLLLLSQIKAVLT
jgi:hypothetical protein